MQLKTCTSKYHDLSNNKVDITLFGKHKNTLDGLQTSCRVCLREAQKVWRSNKQNYNKQKERSRQCARVLKATPRWLTEDHETQIRQFYIEASKLTIETGTKHEVDHIDPLRGKQISGLHVPWDLQILTKELNTKKGNTFLS